MEKKKPDLVTLYKDTSRILLGCELIYPDLVVLPKLRYSLERLSYSSDALEEIMNDFFGVLKSLDDYDQKSADLEYVISSRVPSEFYYGVMRLLLTMTGSVESAEAKYFLDLIGGNRESENHVSIDNEKGELLLASLMAIINLTNSKVFEGLRVFVNNSLNNVGEEELFRILLGNLDELSKNENYKVCAEIKELILEKEPVFKIKRIIKILAKIEENQNLALLSRVYEHYFNLGSDLQLWKFLHQLTGIHLFSRVKVLRDRGIAQRLGESFSKGQIESKLWAINELNKLKSIKKKNILLLCSWYGLFSRMFFDFLDEENIIINTVDIDESCFEASNTMNFPEVSEGKYVAYAKDIFDLDYEHYIFQNNESPDLIINTSCEHIENFSEWYNKIRTNEFVLLQSNDFFDCEEHVNCVENLEEFKKMAPMKNVVYQGAMKFEKYTRFMLIGSK